MTARDGEAEMVRANKILQQEAPSVPPVPSPGRAAFVTALYDMGRRGEDLDYRGWEDRWVVLAGGSSSAHGDYFVVHANEKEVTVHSFDLQRDTYAKHGESPAVPAGKTLLRGSKEILQAIGTKHSQEAWKAFKRLCLKHGGPVTFGGKGQPPKVYLPELIEWHNNLLKKLDEREDASRNRDATLESGFEYGRPGVEVKPDIDGYVRERPN